MFRIFGPPGTGKTTTLLNMVDDALESGIHPHRIAFLAFTRKAANEAKERAATRFGLDPSQAVGPSAADVNFGSLDVSVTAQQKLERVEQHISKIKARTERFYDEPLPQAEENASQ